MWASPSERKTKMSISIGATGHLIQGDVLDTNKKHLESVIKHYEPRLYLKWNPTKRQGEGKWELRILPETKSIIDVVKYGGNTYCVVDYRENNFDNHVWDLESLNYSVLDRLRECDTWKHSDYERGKQQRITQFLNKMDLTRESIQDREKANLQSDMLYNLKQDKKILRDFQEKILSGVDPAHLMRYWK